MGLVEVGSSAGLCLYPDRYSYEFDGRPVGPRSAVHLATSTTGAVPVPDRLPEVVARVGIDQNPLDPADPDDRAWLRALVWPGPNAAARLDRLDAAAAIAAGEPATVLTGDLIERLPEALDLLPAGCTPVVFHTAVLAYLERGPPGGVRRPGATSLGVRWIAQEAAGDRPGDRPRRRRGRSPSSCPSTAGRSPSPRRTAAGSTGCPDARSWPVTDGSRAPPSGGDASASARGRGRGRRTRATTRELLADGDRRNVVDRYRYWTVEAIVADLDRRRHPFHVAIENFGHDLNIGTVVRTANAFLAAEVHIVGRRRWNRRGAMVTDRYQHVRHHADVAGLLAFAAAAGCRWSPSTTRPGAVPLETAAAARAVRCCCSARRARG